MNRIALFVAAAVASTLTGCGFGCTHETTYFTALGANAPFRHDAGSNPAVTLENTLVGIDGDGRATYSTPDNWGDMAVNVDFGKDLPSLMWLSMHDVADALVQSRIDLQAAAPGTVLPGQTFQLACASNPDGCIAYDDLVGADVTATATVVAPTGTPPELFTLRLAGQVTAMDGTTLAFAGTLPFDLFEDSREGPGMGDCS